MRCRPLLLSLLAAVLLGAGAAPAAAQSGDPFEPLPSAPAEPPVVVPTASDDDEGLQSWQQTLLIAGGTLLVLGIGVAIARDARRHAPDDSRGPGRAAEGFAGGAGADPERRNVAARDRRRARARARTARASRKKNR